MKITKEAEVRIPLVPNFIFVGEDNVPIKEFTEEQLRELGQEWVEELVKRSKLKN